MGGGACGEKERTLPGGWPPRSVFASSFLYASSLTYWPAGEAFASAAFSAPFVTSKCEVSTAAGMKRSV